MSCASCLFEASIEKCSQFLPNIRFYILLNFVRILRFCLFIACNFQKEGFSHFLRWLLQSLLKWITFPWWGSSANQCHYCTELSAEVRNRELWPILVSNRGHFPSPPWKEESPRISCLETLSSTSACEQWAWGSGSCEGPFRISSHPEGLCFLWAEQRGYCPLHEREVQIITWNSACWGFNMFVTSPKDCFSPSLPADLMHTVLRNWIWEQRMCFIWGFFICLFWSRVSYCSPEWLPTLTDPPSSAT